MKQILAFVCFQFFVLTAAFRGFKTPVLSLSSKLSNSIAAFDFSTEKKLPWKEEGYKTWKWRDYKINYVDLGGGDDKPPLLLIHGFGASAYHWRYNIPELAKKYHVFAIDMLGFGLSDKPIIEYKVEVWRDQVLDFIKEIVHSDKKNPCIVAGNSLGGFTALYAASDEKAIQENLINGCILLNSAGRFRPTVEEVIKEKPLWQQKLFERFQKFLIGLSFIYTKQPSRISQVLKQVYPVDSSMVDEDLVKSIQFPAQDPNAAEVFYRVVSRNGNGPPIFVDDLLAVLKVPLLLLWGKEDPWIRPHFADKMMSLFPTALRVDVDAGHCPHDEAPDAVNAAIAEFAEKVHSKKILTTSAI